jgi:hypothetical protein
MTEHQLREQEVQLGRYRLLQREVTDPLAACLLHSIIEELEADLRRNSASIDAALPQTP